MKNLSQNIDRLSVICENMKNMEVRQLATINKLRRMNGKQYVSSFEEHRLLKLEGK